MKLPKFKNPIKSHLPPPSYWKAMKRFKRDQKKMEASDSVLAEAERIFNEKNGQSAGTDKNDA